MHVVRRYWIWFVAAVVILAVIGSLNAPAEEPPTGGTNPSASDTPADTRCEPATAITIEGIEAGLTVEGGGSLANSRAVRSDDFENVYFVAARIEGPGMDDIVGVWATNSTDGAGLIFSANSFAAEFSDWGDGPGYSSTDDGHSETEACVQ